MEDLVVLVIVAIVRNKFLYCALNFQLGQKIILQTFGSYAFDTHVTVYATHQAMYILKLEWEYIIESAPICMCVQKTVNIGTYRYINSVSWNN